MSELNKRVKELENSLVYTEDVTSPDGCPSFQQGGTCHEIQELVTAEMCIGIVQRIKELRSKLTAAQTRLEQLG